jgi:hypothetical protein
MKKIALFIFAAFIVSTGLMGQKKNVVKTDLFSAFLRTGVLKYERALNESMSLQLGAFYTGYSPGDTDAKLSGFGITPEFRYYLSATPAPNGIYLAPNFRYMSLTVSDNVDEGTLISNSIALNLGYQMILKEVVAIDAWLGPVYAFRNITGDVDPGISTANGFGVRVGIAIGIVF